MFNLRAVRERVIKKLQIIGRADEDALHMQYTIELHKEFSESGVEAARMKALIADMVSGHLPAKGLVLVDAARLSELEQKLSEFIAGLK